MGIPGPGLIGVSTTPANLLVLAASGPGVCFWVPTYLRFGFRAFAALALAPSSRSNADFMCLDPFQVVFANHVGVVLPFGCPCPRLNIVDPNRDLALPRPDWVAGWSDALDPIATL